MTAPFATEDVRPGLRLGPSPLGKIPSEWSEYGASVESSLEGWVIGATPSSIGTLFLAMQGRFVAGLTSRATKG